MKFLKGLALALIGFLLFLSLTAFGIVHTVMSTALNPDFVTAQLDSFDSPSLARDIISGQVQKGGIPQGLGNAVVSTITKLDPLVKEQINAAIRSTYGYLLGKESDLDLALILRDTVLSKDFVAAVEEEIEVAPLVSGFVKEKVSGQIPEELVKLGLEDFINSYLDDIIDDTLADVEPWLKEQMVAASDPAIDYVLGKRQNFSVSMSLDTVKAAIKDNLWEAIQESPPPLLGVLPEEQRKQFFDLFYPALAAQLPSTFEVDETIIGTNVPATVAGIIAKAEQNLTEARGYIAYFQQAYNLLIALMVVLVLAFILIHRNVKAITRGLGTLFVTYGVIEYGGILLSRNMALPQLGGASIPAQLQSWLPQFVNELFAPLEMFSLVVLITGVVLLVVSFVWKPRGESES